MKISSIIAGLLLLSCGSASRYPQGEALYAYFCQSCHMEDGTGLLALYPPVADSDYLAARPHELACIIRHGLRDSISVNGVLFTTPMEGVKQLTSVEISNIQNYLRERWYPQWPVASEDYVEANLEACNLK